MPLDLEYYMRQAIEKARAAAASGEVPVGALLVVPDTSAQPLHNCLHRCISAANACEALNSGLAHAELLVLHQAAQTLHRRHFEDATLFVTMEPCPMCAGAIVLARVGRLVWGCPDSRWGAAGSVFNIPAHPSSGFKPQLIGGILEDECRLLLQDFFRSLRR